MDFIYYDSSLSEKINDNWVRGVGSVTLHMNHMLNNPQWKEYERVVIVEGLTLDSLLEKHKVTSIDFLKIDVEGNEYPILENYSWNVKPSMIKIETKLWENREISFGISIFEPIWNMLIENGYIIWNEENDLYAIR